LQLGDGWAPSRDHKPARTADAIAHALGSSCLRGAETIVIECRAPVNDGQNFTNGNAEGA